MEWLKRRTVKKDEELGSTWMTIKGLVKTKDVLKIYDKNDLKTQTQSFSHLYSVLFFIYKYKISCFGIS